MSKKEQELYWRRQGLTPVQAKEMSKEEKGEIPSIIERGEYLKALGYNPDVEGVIQGYLRWEGMSRGEKNALLARWGVSLLDWRELNDEDRQALLEVWREWNYAGTEGILFKGTEELEVLEREEVKERWNERSTWERVGWLEAIERRRVGGR